MTSDPDTPWELPKYGLKPPASLKEAMLQVAYLDLATVRELQSTKRQTWWSECARLRINEPAEFRAFCHLLKIDPPEQNVAQQELLTIAEAARRMRVVRRTIHNWINGGQIETVKLPSGRTKVVAQSLTLKGA